jgi:hypothetical protein
VRPKSLGHSRNRHHIELTSLLPIGEANKSIQHEGCEGDTKNAKWGRQWLTPLTGEELSSATSHRFRVASATGLLWSGVMSREMN